MKKRKWLKWTLSGVAVFFGLGLIAVIKVDKLICCCNGQDTVQIFVNDTMNAVLFRYRIDHGNYPTTEQGLAALTQRPIPYVGALNWKGPYLEKMPLDPWAREYQYRNPGLHNPQKYDLWSMGPDGVNSEDDIGNW